MDQALMSKEQTTTARTRPRTNKTVESLDVRGVFPVPATIWKTVNKFSLFSDSVSYCTVIVLETVVIQCCIF